ncbi:MAG: transporter substrate-binding domain-containing protein [Verrucomicrobia bacterium]|nr:transporter substrate-binding domain-containing protein [Verrucomicrobiota bacterium]
MKKIMPIGLLAILLGSGCGERADRNGSPIREGGVLRVLRPATAMASLPRGESPEAREAVLIRNFAKDHDVEIEWVEASPARLADELLEGRADVAIGCRLGWIDTDAKILFSRSVFSPVKPGSSTDELVDVGGDDPNTVWAVPQSSGKLLKSLNAFLVKEHPGVVPKSRYGDLAAMKERGYIRVLTRNNPACYFIHRGELMGFEYELVKQYADHQGLDIVMIVPPRWADLKQWLVEGRGDVVAACITISEDRKKSTELGFCHPYGKVQEIVVTRKSDTQLRSLNDLSGRTVHVREFSHYWTTMEKLKNESGIDFKIKAVPGTMETREILHRVESGEFDLTVADSGFLDIETNSGRKLRSALMFRTPYNYGWVVRKNNPILSDSINEFLRQKVGTSDYNYLYGKYFNRASVVGEFQDKIRSLEKAVISPYDDLIRVPAEKHGFHWCLVAAQMYQESRFDPKAKSWSGARGLMQLMPATAGELGLSDRNILDPAKNIDAGVRYLGQQRKRVPDEVDAFNRLCFGLAAYNGGYGHLIDARALAEKLGHNPDLWVENVDHAYSLLSTPEYADKARYGYCRSEEITGYVRKIIARYVSYKSDIERLAKTAE